MFNIMFYANSGGSLPLQFYKQELTYLGMMHPDCKCTTLSAHLHILKNICKKWSTTSNSKFRESVRLISTSANFSIKSNFFIIKSINGKLICIRTFQGVLWSHRKRWKESRFSWSIDGLPIWFKCCSTWTRSIWLSCKKWSQRLWGLMRMSWIDTNKIKRRTNCTFIKLQNKIR